MFPGKELSAVAALMDARGMGLKGGGALGGLFFIHPDVIPAVLAQPLFRTVTHIPGM